MNGAHSRRKGAAFERLVAGIMREAGFDDAKRGIGQQRSGGEVADVDGLEAEGWWPECKHGTCTPMLALAQARNAVEGVHRDLKPPKCKACKGTGFFEATMPGQPVGPACSACKGSGKGRKRKPRKIQGRPGLTPVAITRRNGGPILVTMDLAAWIALLLDRRALRELRARQTQPEHEVK